MQTPTLPPGTQPAAPSASTGQSSLPSGNASLPNPPPTLATALQNAGGGIPATITARPQPGQLTLTISGQSVTVQTPLPLPVGTSVTASLQSLGPPATLFLQPTQATATQAGQTPSASPQAGTGASGQTAGQAATLGSGVGAPNAGTVNAGANAAPSVVTSMTTGSVLTATVTNPTAQTTANAAPGAGTAPAATATQLPAGTSLSVRLLALAPPGTALSNAGSPGALPGTVLAQTSGGVSVQTSLGTLSLKTGNPPQPGTQLLLQQVGDARLPAPGSGIADGSGARFDALRDAVALLRGSGDAGGAAQRLAQLLPQPNSQFGLAAVFLAQAMRQGKIDKWAGTDTLDALRNAAGQSGKAGGLERELAQTPQRTTDAAGQDWRVMSLPFQNQGAVEAIRLYMRDRPKDEESGPNDPDPNAKQNRFVIEAEFSRIGPIQLDGLTQEKRVDVMVRTHKPFEPSERAEIVALFADTVSAMGLTGQLDFRVVQQFDLQPPPETNRTASGVTV